MSGRTINSLLDFFKGLEIDRINWSGVHGAQIKYEGCNIFVSNETKKILPTIWEIKEKISKIIKNISCYNLEDKEVTFAIHYRKCANEDLIYLKKINEVLKDYIDKAPIEFMQMKKVIEAKPKGINKGDTIVAINKRYKDYACSVNICLGDDLTDEYLFRSNMDGINIKVGENKTFKSQAEYILKKVSEVHWFLNKLYYYF